MKEKFLNLLEDDFYFYEFTKKDDPGTNISQSGKFTFVLRLFDTKKIFEHYQNFSGLARNFFFPSCIIKIKS